MYGRAIVQDIPIDPRHVPGAFGAARAYRPDVTRPYVLVPQNLRASNKPSETNIGNIERTMVVWQSPVQAKDLTAGRLISRYTFLPVGASALATFGST